MTEKLTFGGASEGAPPPVVREVNVDPEPNGEVAGSLLSELRKAAKEQQEIHHIDMPVGGKFGKRLQIRYQPLEPGAMDRYITRRGEIRDRQEADPRLGIPFTELNMDLMAQACAAMIGADEKGENKIVLKDETGTLRLDHRLADMLELPVPGGIQATAHDVIMLLFGNNALAIVDHGDDLLAWLRDPTEQPKVGES
jgi:hypothetical protein